MIAISILALACLLGADPTHDEPPKPRVLVFSKTAAYRHDSIAAGVAAVRELGGEGGFAVDATEDAGQFTPENLSRYRAVVFINRSGDVLERSTERGVPGLYPRRRRFGRCAPGRSPRWTSGRGTLPWSAA